MPTCRNRDRFLFDQDPKSIKTVKFCVITAFLNNHELSSRNARKGVKIPNFTIPNRQINQSTDVFCSDCIPELMNMFYR
ncbi:hypothetical protein L2E82_01960 [Cichorium intybus]|uniref:Uncharacterized protein n=1 Tax=Cichorium intybus TaxID=13427 RepID=A0ACB9H0Z5_CICIN|nr:hypothetical protein L2E82_01960 [Cichorium intybus]